MKVNTGNVCIGEKIYNTNNSSSPIIRNLSLISTYISQSPISQYTILDIDSTNLISHYKFDDDFNDSTSYNNNLILSTISPPNLNNNGIIGKALQFQNNIDTDTLTNGIRDGTVKIPTINLVNKEVTISFWIKLLNDFDSFSGIFVFGEKNKTNRFWLY